MKRTPVVYALLCALTLTCCSTGKAGLVSGEDGREYLPLAPGAVAYMYADVARVKPIVHLFDFMGVDMAQAGDMIDRTDTAAIGFYPAGGTRRFILAGEGKYPNVRAGIGMFFSTAWKQRRSETNEKYWYSEKNKSAVSMSATRVYVSDGDPLTAPPGVAAPEGFSTFQRDAVLALWMDDASAPLNKFIGSMGLPLQVPVNQLMLSLHEADQRYSALIRLEAESATLARGLAAAISFMRLFMPQTALTKDNPAGIASLLLANEVEATGSYLTIRTGEFDVGELELIVTLLTR